MSVANLAFRACASLAFWSWKEPLDDAAAVVVAGAASAEEGAAAAVVVAAACEAVVLGASSEQSSSSPSSPASEVLEAELALALAVALGVELEAESEAEPEDDESMFWRPGSDVMSVSCEPSAMGPAGFAGHDPRGERGALWPKGMVPAAPTVSPPTNELWFAPWNWHWNRPFSSVFLGACWQYGTAREFGCRTECV